MRKSDGKLCLAWGTDSYIAVSAKGEVTELYTHRYDAGARATALGIVAETVKPFMRANGQKSLGSANSDEKAGNLTAIAYACTQVAMREGLA